MRAAEQPRGERVEREEAQTVAELRGLHGLVAVPRDHRVVGGVPTEQPDRAHRRADDREVVAQLVHRSERGDDERPADDPGGQHRDDVVPADLTPLSQRAGPVRRYAAGQYNALPCTPWS